MPPFDLYNITHAWRCIIIVIIIINITPVATAREAAVIAAAAVGLERSSEEMASTK